MNIKKTLASTLVGGLVASAAMMAAASPAAAIDEGTLLPGGIGWFNQAGPLSAQSPATQIFGGTGTARTWTTLTTENPCPAGSAQLASYVRIPQVGVPENEWSQVPEGAAALLKDADGRFYTDQTAPRAALSFEVQAYNEAHGGAGDFPFLSVCRTAAAISTGYFRMMMHIEGVDPMGSDASWNIIEPTWHYDGSSQQAQATTTTLTASASGSDLALTATVAPAAAGEVTFKDGGTTLGTATVSGGTASYTVTSPSPGPHTFSADFAPADTDAYLASTGSLELTLGLDTATGELVLVVPGAPTGVGSLTFSVPFDVPVQLAGAWSGDDSRITASAAFPTVTVTDTRSDDILGHWEVNAQASDFTGTAGVIGAKYLGWTPDSSATPDAGSPLVTQDGSAVASFLDDGESTGLATSRTLGESATPGRGSATLDAQLNLAIPPSSAEGQYVSTVTVTLIAD